MINMVFLNKWPKIEFGSAVKPDKSPFYWCSAKSMAHESLTISPKIQSLTSAILQAADSCFWSHKGKYAAACFAVDFILYTSLHRWFKYKMQNLSVNLIVA